MKIIRLTITCGVLFISAAMSVYAKTITLEQLSTQQIETLRTARIVFKEYPKLVNVAFCESSLEHTEEDGSVKRGKVDPRDTGVMQINVGYHHADAERLGLDLEVRMDNMQYAIFLVTHQGMQPWAASQHCWENLNLPEV